MFLSQSIFEIEAKIIILRILRLIKKTKTVCEGAEQTRLSERRNFFILVHVARIIIAFVIVRIFMSVTIVRRLHTGHSTLDVSNDENTYEYLHVADRKYTMTTDKSQA